MSKPGGRKIKGQKTLASGYITLDDLRKVGNIPPNKILEERPVPIIEDIEEIPCTPCRDVCPTGAIIMPSMNDPPKVMWEACTGCTLCVQACPGLAITLVNISFSRKVLKRNDIALVSIPYEMIPVPERGDRVRVYDRGHNYLCDSEVYSVIKSIKFGTIVVNVLVPKQYALQAKHLEVIKGE